ncbi:hypothetical protein [Chakrabartyella piscis]|uniref:hypothetical protein n=1 Tax=Chakrabartyella piscis TaxID=2918914 RepID=UPI00295836A7|nr:hypothetical protein [Chakrabartyella piscis]
MAYADYTYYTEEYLGTLAEDTFLRLARKATAYINLVTGGNITEEDAELDEIKETCCGLVDIYDKFENGGDVASETNDGISVSYTIGTSIVKTEVQQLNEVVELYLGNTGLLYRGVGRC